MKASVEVDREIESPVNVIKRVADGDVDRGVIKNQAIAARQAAEQIVARAQAEADAIVRDAKAESVRVLEEAYGEGLERALTEFEKDLFAIREVRENVMQGAEDDLIKLAVKIAEKIVGNELTSSKNAVVDIISTALKNARQREKVTVFVNPSDLKLVTAHAEKFSSEQKIRMLDFVADPTVDAGGCVIETEVGKIDAQLKTQLSVIENSLLNQAEGERNI